MVLSIDSSDPINVKLILTANAKTVVHSFQCAQNLSEQLTFEIQKFLKKQKLKLSEIKKIEVAPGPGHFSRIRTVVATANALNYALQTKQKLIQPTYSQGPNISSTIQPVDKFPK